MSHSTLQDLLHKRRLATRRAADTPIQSQPNATVPLRHRPAQSVSQPPKEEEGYYQPRTDECVAPVTEPLNISLGHPLSEKNVKTFGQFMEERSARSRQGSVKGAESHYSGVTAQTMASIQEELTQTKEIMADLAQSVKSLAEEVKQFKLSTRNAEARKGPKHE